MEGHSQEWNRTVQYDKITPAVFSQYFHSTIKSLWLKNLLLNSIHRANIQTQLYSRLNCLLEVKDNTHTVPWTAYSKCCHQDTLTLHQDRLLWTLCNQPRYFTCSMLFTSLCKIFFTFISSLTKHILHYTSNETNCTLFKIPQSMFHLNLPGHNWFSLTLQSCKLLFTSKNIFQQLCKNTRCIPFHSTGYISSHSGLHNTHFTSWHTSLSFHRTHLSLLFTLPSHFISLCNCIITHFIAQYHCNCCSKHSNHKLHHSAIAQLSNHEVHIILNIQHAAYSSLQSHSTNPSARAQHTDFCNDRTLCSLTTFCNPTTYILLLNMLLCHETSDN